ncbi:MAG: methyltransferase domain-containing protein [Pseudomonadota bacterium]
MPSDARELGQFIPAHYHANMLNDEARMRGFYEAITRVVPQGGKVVELGGGTGVLSFFAAQRAAQVWCVEFNPELVALSRSLLAQNQNGHRVEVVHADASTWLPPAPVDVVVCEMLHTGLLREQQAAVLHSFKQGYLARFGGPLPRFVPEACLQAIQPIEQNFVHEGYYAPCLQFQSPVAQQQRSVELGPPTVYQAFCWDETIPNSCSFDGPVAVNRDGQVNALRVITKNLLAIVDQSQRTIDWHNQYMIVPLDVPIDVVAGDALAVSFEYSPGAALSALRKSLTVVRQVADAVADSERAGASVTST